MIVTVRLGYCCAEPAIGKANEPTYGQHDRNDVPQHDLILPVSILILAKLTPRE